MASEPPKKQRKGGPRPVWDAPSPGGTQEGAVAGRHATRCLVDTPGGQNRYPHMHCASADCNAEEPCPDCTKRNRDSKRNARSAKAGAISLRASLSSRAGELDLPVQPLPSRDDPAARAAAQKLLSKQVARAASDEHPSDILEARRAAHQTSPHSPQMEKAMDLVGRASKLFKILESGESDSELDGEEAQRYIAEAIVIYEEQDRCADAYNKLGKLYLYDDGFGIERDAQKSFNYFTRAADMGSSEGHWMLYHAFYSRNTVSELNSYDDDDAALHHLQRAAQGYNCWTDYNCTEVNESQKYLHLGQELAELATYELAWCYEKGDLGCRLDFDESFRLLVTLAGTPAAMRNRDIDDDDGDVWVVQTIAKADAQFNLACAFSRPELGLEIDVALALLYFEAAVNNGNVRVQYELGLSYEDSATRVDFPLQGLLDYYVRNVIDDCFDETIFAVPSIRSLCAHKQSHPGLLVRLGGDTEANADGTDASLALSYCTQAANKGYQKAQLRLGLAYLGGGLGLERCPDLETADMWFARASKVPEDENLTIGCELDISKATQVMLQLSPEEKMRRWPVVDVGSIERVYAKNILEDYVFSRDLGLESNVPLGTAI